jgi:hypothetical protein
MLTIELSELPKNVRTYFHRFLQTWRCSWQNIGHRRRCVHDRHQAEAGNVAWRAVRVRLGVVFYPSVSPWNGHRGRQQPAQPVLNGMAYFICHMAILPCHAPCHTIGKECVCTIKRLYQLERTRWYTCVQNTLVRKRLCRYCLKGLRAIVSLCNGTDAHS